MKSKKQQTFDHGIDILGDEWDEEEDAEEVYPCEPASYTKKHQKPGTTSDHD